MGIPQAAVFSSIIYSIYLQSIPDPPSNVSMVSNVDNCKADFASSVNINTISAGITEYLATICGLFAE